MSNYDYMSQIEAEWKLFGFLYLLGLKSKRIQNASEISVTGWMMQ